MEERELLRTELNELMEGASLLTDDRVYTKESYLDLLTAIGYAKVVLSKESAETGELESAYDRLADAVDALEIKGERSVAKKNKSLTPVLVVGAFCGGLLLGRHLTKKRKKKK